MARPEYGEAWIACVIFLAWWALASNAAIAQTTMFVDGHVRRLAKLSWTIAIVNLALSLALTPWLGLEGVALGTTLAYVALLPAWVRYLIDRFDLSLRELARTAWAPAYGTGLLVAGLALVGRSVFDLDNAATVVAVLVTTVALGWAFFFLVVLTPEERRLAREVAGAPAPAPPPGP